MLAVAQELEKRGFAPAIAVPDRPETIDDAGRPSFPVLSYAETERDGVSFPDGRGPDLVHAFTPRELVRRLTTTISARFGCPYIVHFEDNEEVILTDKLAGATIADLLRMPLPVSDTLVWEHWTHPYRSQAFVAGAAGFTAVLDTLLSFEPPSVPGVVVWPGFDEAVLANGHDVPALRGELGIAPEEFVLVYTGNIHDSNLAEVRSLYLAVGALRQSGLPVTLVRTGWDHVDMAWRDDLGVEGAVHELGFVPRQRVWELLALADALVQPGGSNAFNDFRFPSKLPEFLASGKPVVLPATNIGRYLRDGEDALLLERGDALEIVEAVSRLFHDGELRARLGANGKAFALRELRWSTNVEPIMNLYAEARAPIDAGEASEAPEPPAKIIAFYLPQFHAIPENDEWWGEGFTEWTNVRRGEPAYAGHHQPQVSSELGDYDLSEPGVMEKQAQLARAYGIYGFCFYHYWFSGRRLLERPLERLLATGEPRLPFCVCWANENWTRRWDGAEDDVLLGQDFEPGWSDRFIHDLIPTLADPRYIQVEGAPLLLVYRAELVPDVRRVLERWRAAAAVELGKDLHLAAVQSFGFEDPRTHGFDAAVEFPPHTQRFLVDTDSVESAHPEFRGYLEDYRSVLIHQLERGLPEYRWYRGVMPSWDNTARRGRDAHILINSSPELYELWLRKVILQTLVRSAAGDEPLVFVNAWNEWAEGTHLEPDARHGRAWLEATSHALRDGLRQFYASGGHALSAEDAEAHLRQVLPPL